MKKQYIIPIMLPDKSYPYNCTFYQKGKKTKKTKEEVKKQIDKYLKQESGYEEIEVAFLGKSFTSLEEKDQDELLQTVNDYIVDGKVNNIRILARPDQVTKKLLKKLRKFNVKTIELEVISSNDYILKCTKVPYKYKDIKKAARMIKWRGFTLGCEMMVGLPDSTRIDEFNTSKEIIKLKPNTSYGLIFQAMKNMSYLCNKTN